MLIAHKQVSLSLLTGRRSLVEVLTEQGYEKKSGSRGNPTNSHEFERQQFAKLMLDLERRRWFLNHIIAGKEVWTWCNNCGKKSGLVEAPWIRATTMTKQVNPLVVDSKGYYSQRFIIVNWLKMQAGIVPTTTGQRKGAGPILLHTNAWGQHCSL